MKTDQLNGLIALVAVAEKRSFAAAATELRVTPSAVSQAVKQLEARLGVALLHRTTRSTHPTEIGQRFLERLAPSLREVLSAVDSVGELAQKAIGNLRINLPRTAYALLQPALVAFAREYPEVTFELTFDEQLIDIVEGGYDAGVRLSETVAKDMTALRLHPSFSFPIIASHGYLKRHGRPEKLEDLLSHRCLLYRYPHGGVYDRWEFTRRGRDVSVQVRGALTMNDPLLMIDAVKAGLGLSYALGHLVEDDVRSGKLVTVLDAFRPKSDGIFLYYPSRRQALPKLRAFIEVCRTVYA